MNQRLQESHSKQNKLIRYWQVLKYYSSDLFFFSALAYLYYSINFNESYFTSDESSFSQQANDKVIPVSSSQFSSKNSNLSNTSISSSNGAFGVDYSDATLKLFNSIEYVSGTFKTKLGNRYNVSVLFHSDEYMSLTSYELAYLDIDFKPLSGLYLISYDGNSRLIPVGNPNPDYYHPDGSLSNLSSRTTENENDGARALGGREIGLF